MHEVLNISRESNTLIVRRRFEDTVNIGDGWTALADESIGDDTFEVFVQGAATLKVQLATRTINLRGMSSGQGATLNGILAERAGAAVSNAGDVNGDGYDDLLVGAFRARTSGGTEAGESYLVYGSASLPDVVELGTLGSAASRFPAPIRGTRAVSRSAGLAT